MDLIGLKDTHFHTQFHEDFLFGVFFLLSCLATGCDQLKIQGMVLRIYRSMIYDLNIEILPTARLNTFRICIVKVTVYALERRNLSDIANEDLYNGMLILKASWMKNRMSCINSNSNYVGVLVDSVIPCISRLHYFHHAAITNESKMTNKKNEDDEAKNVNLLIVALEGGLSLINSILTAPPAEGEEMSFSRSPRRSCKNRI